MKDLLESAQQYCCSASFIRKKREVIRKMTIVIRKNEGLIRICTAI